MNFVMIVFAYIIGSIPTGYIIGKVFFKKDIRKYGSGNIGMSNIFRTFGVYPALLTFIGDFLKGYIPVVLSFYMHFLPVWIDVIALFAISGHVFSLFLKFKGGKGIATTMGIIFAINFLIGIFSISVWIITLYFSRYFSLSSLLAVFSTIIFSLFYHMNFCYTYLFLIIFIFSLYTHRGNIKRLISKTERKFG